MMHGFQQIITQAERCDNFVVHGLPPLGDAMGVVPLIWRKKLLDSISGNLGYVKTFYANQLITIGWGSFNFVRNAITPGVCNGGLDDTLNAVANIYIVPTTG